MDGTKYPLNGFNVISQSYSSSVVFRVAGTSEPPAGCLLLSTLFHRGNPPQPRAKDDDWEMTFNRYSVPPFCNS